MRQPEDDGCCDADGRHDRLGASVVAGVDPAPVLEFAEHVLDLVALTVDGVVVRDGLLAVCLSWNAEGDASLLQSGAEPVGIIAPVGEQRLGSREGIDHQLIGLSALGGKFGEDAVEYAQTASANEPVVDRIVRVVTDRRITPQQPVPDHENVAVDDPAIIDPWDAMRQ